MWHNVGYSIDFSPNLAFSPRTAAEFRLLTGDLPHNIHLDSSNGNLWASGWSSYPPHCTAATVQVTDNQGRKRMKEMEFCTEPGWVEWVFWWLFL